MKENVQMWNCADSWAKNKAAKCVRQCWRLILPYALQSAGIRFHRHWVFYHLVHSHRQKDEIELLEKIKHVEKTTQLCHSSWNSRFAIHHSDGIFLKHLIFIFAAALFRRAPRNSHMGKNSRTSFLGPVFTMLLVECNNCIKK